GQLKGLLLAWGIAFLLWQLRLYGGGDAKVLMVLFGFYPAYTHLWAQIGVALAVSIPWLAFRYRRRWRRALRTVSLLAFTGGLLPASRRVHRTNGIPVTWVFALGWLLWRGMEAGRLW
ncbi:MAG: hypothetical protein D6796_08520, partial [Caldilineae bacterium]